MKRLTRELHTLPRLDAHKPLARKCRAFSVYLGSGRIYHWINGNGKISQAIDTNGNALSASGVCDVGPYFSGYRTATVARDVLGNLTGAFEVVGKPISCFMAYYSKQSSTNSNTFQAFNGGGILPGRWRFAFDKDAINVDRLKLEFTDNVSVSSTFTYVFDPTSVSDGSPVYYGASYGSQGFKGYLNGVDITASAEVNTNNHSNVVPNMGGDNSLEIASTPTTFTFVPDFLVSYMFDSELTAAEFGELTRDPLGLLAKREQFATADVPEDNHVIVTPYAKRWTKQPPARTKIDRLHPLANNLVCAVLFNQHQSAITTDGQPFLAGRDLVTGTVPLSQIEGGLSSVRVRSRELNSKHMFPTAFYNHANGDIGVNAVGLEYGTGAKWQRPAITVVAAVNPTVVGGNGSRIVSHSTSGGDNYGLQFVVATTLRWRWNGASLDLTIPNATPGIHHVAGAGSADVSKILAERPDLGTRYSNSTTGATISYTDSGLWIGTNGPGVHRTMEGEIYYVYIFDKVLSDEEIFSIWGDPWQIFKPASLMAPVDKALPDLGSFEVPWDRMPPP